MKVLEYLTNKIFEEIFKYLYKYISQKVSYLKRKQQTTMESCKGIEHKYFTKIYNIIFFKRKFTRIQI